MIRAAIFDVDGTLLNSMHIWKDAGEIFLKKRGIVAEHGLSEILWAMSIPEGAAYLKETYPLTETVEEIMSGIVAVVRNFYCEEVSLKPGVSSFLRKMKEKGIPMVIATSGDRSYLEAAFRRNGIDGYFARVFTCEEVGEGKTKPKIYLEAGKYLGFQPEEIAVFEDAFYAVRTAKAAGFPVIGVSDPFCEVEEKQLAALCDVYLKDFSDDSAFWMQLASSETRDEVHT